MDNEKALAAAVGRTIEKIDGCEEKSEEIRFTFADGSVLKLYHLQDCCESVAVEDVTGDPADLIGGVVHVFEERTSDEPSKSYPDESWTWTLYEVRTTKGDITIRWYGSSNGYYAEMAVAEWVRS